MSATAADSLPRALDMNQPRSLVAAIVMVVIGMETFIVQPGFVQGLVEYAHYTDAQAGYIASAEMFGIAGMTVLLAALAARINWRTIGSLAVAAMVIANAVSPLMKSTESFAAARFIAGLGSGVLISYGYAAIAQTANPDRNFGYLITCVLVYGALGLLAMPAAYGSVGMPGVLIMLAILPIAAWPCLRLLPRRIDNAGSGPHNAVTTASPLHKGMGLAAVFAFFLGQGVIWAYLFLIGLASGISEQGVANGLTISQVAGILGALTATAAGSRISHQALLTISIVLGISPLYFLSGSSNALVYAIAVCVFNYSANVLTPLLMAVVAGFDSSGKLVTRAIALQMMGLALGPAIAAAVLRDDSYRNPLILCAALLAACLAFILPPVMTRRAHPGSVT